MEELGAGSGAQGLEALAEGLLDLVEGHRLAQRVRSTSFPPLAPHRDPSEQSSIPVVFPRARVAGGSAPSMEIMVMYV